MARPALVWAAGARRPEVEEALWSVELESCVLTKLTKPFVPVNLVGSLYWVPARRGSILFLGIIRRHFLAATMDPAVSLSTYSPRLMEVVP